MVAVCNVYGWVGLRRLFFNYLYFVLLWRCQDRALLCRNGGRKRQQFPGGNFVMPLHIYLLKKPRYFVCGIFFQTQAEEK